jgi:ferric iron reductase protein FhuF
MDHQGHAATRPALTDQLAALGPFFAADSHDPRTAPRPPWRPMSELLDNPAVLAERIHAYRASLAASYGRAPEAVELRVAASVAHLGLVARVLSPLLALAVLHGRTEPVNLRDLRWQPTSPSIFPLSIAGLDVQLDAFRPDEDPDPDALARAFADRAVGTVAAELCAATSRFGVSEKVLWGNIASALNGTCAALGSAQPRHRPRIQAVLTRLLRQPVLDGTTQTSLDDRFQRRSCCLIYRATPNRDGMVCGDCVLLGARLRSAG